jgi:hypothetical protein
MAVQIHGAKQLCVHLSTTRSVRVNSLNTKARFREIRTNTRESLRTMSQVLPMISAARYSSVSQNGTGYLPISLDCTQLSPNCWVVLHVLPLQAFRRGEAFDQERLKSVAHSKLNPPHARGGHSSIFCFDGFANACLDANQVAFGYSLLCRNGCLETVDAYSCSEEEKIGKVLRPSIYEGYLRNAIPEQIILLKELGLGGPYILCLSLLHCRDYRILLGPRYGRECDPNQAGPGFVARSDDRRLDPKWRNRTSLNF